MPCTITLTTLPATRRLTRYGVETAFNLLAPTLAKETILFHRLGDIAAEVKAFGERVRAQAPDASFIINLRVAKGHRKFPGYDAADRAGTFGQDAFIHVIDESATSAEPVS
jgi:hypothetical protein